MQEDGPIADSAVAKTLHTLEFHGSGGEYFRIWIVNIALTIITLGIYGAWAKVRTVRYLRGNTFLAGHPFDYHASPVRILIGRIIAVTFLIGYSVSARIHPALAAAWGLFFLFVAPWLVVSSLRFNARNTSYRNVRFNFVGSLGGAAKVYILWPFLAVFSLFLAWPLVHRARDYYFINHHTFGGKPFDTGFSGWDIYKIYLMGIGAYLIFGTVVLVGFGAIMAALGVAIGSFNPQTVPPPLVLTIVVFMYVALIFVGTLVQVYIHAKTMNLALNNTTLYGRHELRSNLQALPMAWIVFTNAILLLVTIGLYYPWARVRLYRYETERFGLLAYSNLDEFTSEAIATQGAIGEEIASFFDFGISL